MSLRFVLFDLTLFAKGDDPKESRKDQALRFAHLMALHVFVDVLDLFKRGVAFKEVAPGACDGHVLDGVALRVVDSVERRAPRTMSRRVAAAFVLIVQLVTAAGAVGRNAVQQKIVQFFAELSTVTASTLSRCGEHVFDSILRNREMRSLPRSRLSRSIGILDKMVLSVLTTFVFIFLIPSLSVHFPIVSGSGVPSASFIFVFCKPAIALLSELFAISIVKFLTVLFAFFPILFRPLSPVSGLLLAVFLGVFSVVGCLSLFAFERHTTKNKPRVRRTRELELSPC